MPPPEEPQDRSSHSEKPPENSLLADLQAALDNAATDISQESGEGAGTEKQVVWEIGRSNDRGTDGDSCEEGKDEITLQVESGEQATDSCEIGEDGGTDGNHFREIHKKAGDISSAFVRVVREETRQNEIHILKAMICGIMLVFLMWNIPFIPHSVGVMIAGGMVGFMARNEISAAIASLLPLFLFQTGFIVYKQIMMQPGREMLEPLTALHENPYMGDAASSVVGAEITLFLIYFVMALVGGMFASTLEDIARSAAKSVFREETRRGTGSENKDVGSRQTETEGEIEGKVIDEDAVEKKVIGEDAVESEAIDEDAIEKRGIEEDAVERKVIEEDAVESEAIDEDAVERKVIDDDAVERKVIDDDAVERKVIEDDAVEKKVIEDDAVERKVIEDDAVEKKVIAEDAIEKKVIEDDVVERKIVEGDAVERKAIDEDAVERKMIEGDTVEWKTIENVDIRREEIEMNEIQRKEIEKAELERVRKEIMNMR